MDREVVKAARAQVRNRLGADLASKASDVLCVAFAQQAPAVAAGLEAVGLEAAAGPQSLRNAVVEFEPKRTLMVELTELAEALRQEPGWTRLRRTAKRSRAAEGNLVLQAPQLLRQAKVLSVRNDFYQTAGTLRDAIERGARNFSRPGSESDADARTRTAVSDVCWLNRSMRTRVDARVLAEVAADPTIERVDLPRRLEADIVRSARTVGAPQFRKKLRLGGKDVIIAVIDSEVALRHPAFGERIIHRRNFTAEPWGNPGEHGTAVAGIAAGNGDPFVGMAPEAMIYNYKVLATNRFLNGDDFDGALALQQAVEDGAHIANCSWGAGATGDGTSREARACDAAWALGLTVVKSAGNTGPGADTLTTPADADGVIVVGATDQDGTALQDYSSRGPLTSGKLRPHMVAPGGTVTRGIDSCLIEGGFGDCGYGTSFAAPHVAGLLALLLDRDPDLTPDQQRDMLLSVCETIGAADSNTQGQGLVSLTRLLS